MASILQKASAFLAAFACATALGAAAAMPAFANSESQAVAEPLAATQIGTQASNDRTWGLESIYASEAWAIAKSDAPASGQQPVCIAVIDTGFYAAHADLAGNVVAKWNAASYDPSNPRSTPSSDVTPPAALGSGNESSDHGTHIAGILGAIAGNNSGVDGVSYNAKLVLIRVSDDEGITQTSSLINAFKLIRAHAKEYNIRVVNLSIGFPFETLPAPGDGTGDSLLYDEIDGAYDEGIVTVCSAGNKTNSFKPPFYNFPGDYPKVVSVIALKRTENTLLDSHVVERDSDYSNYNMPNTTSETGNKDISAPGTNICSTAGTSGSKFYSGTSQAAAFVSGTLALVFTANPDFTAEQAVNRIYDTATDLGDAGWDEQTGWGEVNALRAVDPNAKLPDDGTDSGDDDGGDTPSGDSGDTPAATPISQATVSLVATSFKYSGSPIAPSVSVTYDGKRLVNGTDYSVSYSDNRDAGQATVTVTGTGKFTGSTDAHFTITKADQHPTTKTTSRKVKYAKVKKKAQTVPKMVTVKKAKGTVTYKLASVSKKAAKKKFSVNSKTGKVTVKKGCRRGTYKLKIKVKATGDTNYNSFAKTVTVKLTVK